MRLVRAGCATARTEHRGRRRSVAVYAITDRGRAALQDWAATPPAFPALEASVLVRTLFGGFGDTAALIRSLHAQRDEARALLDRLDAQAAEYPDTGGPFPDRLGWIAINGVFLRDYLAMLASWSGWAADQAGTLAADPAHADRLVRILADGGLPHRATGTGG